MTLDPKYSHVVYMSYVRVQNIQGLAITNLDPTMYICIVMQRSPLIPNPNLVSPKNVTLQVQV